MVTCIIIIGGFFFPKKNQDGAKLILQNSVNLMKFVQIILLERNEILIGK